MQLQHLNTMNQGHDAQNSLNNHFDGKTWLGLRYDNFIASLLAQNYAVEK